MRIIVLLLFAMQFISTHTCFAEGPLKLNEATISGVNVKIGQGADIVQSRIKADRFVSSGYNYGDLSKGYYTDNGTTYIITYGPPESGSGAYVVTRIEQISTPNTKQVASGVARVASTREQVVEARRKFKVRVISFDASQKFGTEFPYSDYVRLEISNNSDLVLSTLTVLTKRFDGKGRMIGSSRSPAISVRDLKPGQSAEVDYYPRGHLPGVNSISVEIESLISPENEQFIKELSFE